MSIVIKDRNDLEEERKQAEKEKRIVFKIDRFPYFVRISMGLANLIAAEILANIRYGEEIGSQWGRSYMHNPILLSINAEKKSDIDFAIVIYRYETGIVVRINMLCNREINEDWFVYKSDVSFYEIDKRTRSKKSQKKRKETWWFKELQSLHEVRYWEFPHIIDFDGDVLAQIKTWQQENY